MRYYERRRQPLGITSPRAPWRRAAKPLAVLFCLQLSGIGCAARAPQPVAPTRPEEFGSLLAVYEEQLDREGMSLEGAEDYVTGTSPSPMSRSIEMGDFGQVQSAASGVTDGTGSNGIGGNGVGGNGAGGGEDGGNGAAAAGAGTTASGDAGDDETLPPSLALAQNIDSQMTFKDIDGIAEYIFGPGDLVQLTPYLGPEPSLTTTHRVQTDGTIHVSRFHLGSVMAAGVTPTELSRTLTTMFRQYVPTGFAEVRVDEYNAWNATLTGEIRDTPNGGAGNYPIRGRMTLTEFINSYGGPTAAADLADVRVIRDGNEFLADLSSMLAGTTDEYTVHAGDIVYVPSIETGSSRMFIFGEVREPGVYTYREGISVLDAIAQAGGWTNTAKRSAVYVSRPTTGEVIPVDLDTLLSSGQTSAAVGLEPGDFVVVPFSPDRSQKIRDWVGIATLILSTLTVIELIRRD